MLQKIDKNLIYRVQTTANKNIMLDCILYGKNYEQLKNKVSNVYKLNITSYYPFINSVGMKLNMEQICRLSNYECVKFISSMAKVSALINVSKKIHEVNVLDQLNTLNNVTIAVIDTGIFPHLDFTLRKNRILKFIDLINNRKFPYDDNGHGTFTSGIMCGSGVISNELYSGIMPSANIVAIKALNENGETGAGTILDAMQWVIDNKEKYNIKVVCMSFGSEPIGINDPLILGAEVLWNNGIVVVSAAGNSGPDKESIKSPGASTKIITVGALDDKRQDDGKFFTSKFSVADFSSRGPIYNYYKPDLLASGVNIMSTSNFENKKWYTKMSGTSVATPIVAGIVAKMLSKKSNLTPINIKSMLINSCEKITGNRNEEGYGWLNLKKLK